MVDTSLMNTRLTSSHVSLLLLQIHELWKITKRIHWNSHCVDWQSSTVWNVYWQTKVWNVLCASTVFAKRIWYTHTKVWALCAIRIWEHIFICNQWKMEIDSRYWIHSSSFSVDEMIWENSFLGRESSLMYWKIHSVALTSVIDAAVQLNDNRPPMYLIDKLR